MMSKNNTQVFSLLSPYLSLNKNILEFTQFTMKAPAPGKPFDPTNTSHSNYQSSFNTSFIKSTTCLLTTTINPNLFAGDFNPPEILKNNGDHLRLILELSNSYLNEAAIESTTITITSNNCDF